MNEIDTWYFGFDFLNCKQSWGSITWSNFTLQRHKCESGAQWGWYAGMSHSTWEDSSVVLNIITSMWLFFFFLCKLPKFYCKILVRGWIQSIFVGSFNKTVFIEKWTVITSLKCCKYPSAVWSCFLGTQQKQESPLRKFLFLRKRKHGMEILLILWPWYFVWYSSVENVHKLLLVYHFQRVSG